MLEYFEYCLNSSVSPPKTNIRSKSDTKLPNPLEGDALDISDCVSNPWKDNFVRAHRLSDYRHTSYSLPLLEEVETPFELLLRGVTTLNKPIL